MTSHLIRVLLPLQLDDAAAQPRPRRPGGGRVRGAALPEVVLAGVEDEGAARDAGVRPVEAGQRVREGGGHLARAASLHVAQVTHVPPVGAGLGAAVGALGYIKNGLMSHMPPCI